MNEFKINGYLRSISREIFDFVKENNLCSLNIWVSLFEHNPLDIFNEYNIPPTPATINFYKFRLDDKTLYDARYKIISQDKVIIEDHVYRGAYGVGLNVSNNYMVSENLYVSYSKENCINEYNDNLYKYITKLRNNRFKISNTIDDCNKLMENIKNDIIDPNIIINKGRWD